ncbi:D-alanyl-D-alanine carboxypeptidase/D-alanyl-D-alanine endopeptidase [Saccharopolyspora sp. CA-218241]|uniref:D-alanyl-D-alanine carboxypeptidase/D-alanyl-D-alanine endopeptidase n=1 Tax=Saccharopolyspora sp. CA-218241 TaxID=3240027 RepID=UPI003D96A759
MRRAVLVGLVGAVLLPLVGAVPSAAARTGPEALRADLDEILADPRLDGAHAGVVVRDPATDEVLYRRQADARATPASGAKLLTAAAALEELGPEHRFRTDVVTDAPRRGPVLLGDLHLRGTGDPTLREQDLHALAEQVAASGVRVVRGQLKADASWFDDVPLGTGWMWDDEPYYYAAPVSALTLAPTADFDAGTALVRTAPGEPGGPAVVEVVPRTDAVRIDNRATTAAPGTAPDVRVRREHGGDTVVVSGSVPAGGAPVEDYTSVRDPAAYAVDVFARVLREHGVRVGGTGAGVAPAGARTLAERESMPLRDLLLPFLKLSNNGHAEVLVKAMGRKARGAGTWDAGLAVVEERLAGLGIGRGTFRLVDGSGLSTMDAVSPAQLALLLDNARQRPWFAVFAAALPVAGIEDRAVGGTLRGRMDGTAAEGVVRAKTGSLTGVTSLSGYVTAADGTPLIFSVLFNDFLSDSPKDLEDAVAIRLAEYRGAADRPREAAPLPNAGADDPVTRVDEGAVECSWTKSC